MPEHVVTIARADAHSRCVKSDCGRRQDCGFAEGTSRWGFRPELVAAVDDIGNLVVGCCSFREAPAARQHEA